MSWTHRERILAALNLEEADRVPIDFGSSPATSITLPAYERLKEYLGLEHETVVMSKTSRLALPDDAILERFGVDTGYLSCGLDGIDIDQHTVLDDWGVTWQQAPDGQFMPVNGPFCDKEPDIKDLESWEWPDPDDPARYIGVKERAQALRDDGYAVVLTTTTGFASQGQWIRGFGDWLRDLYKHREYAVRMMDISADLWLAMVRNAIQAAEGMVDVVFMGDDLSSQENPLFSPDIYRELIKPRQQAQIEALKSEFDTKIMYHSCGAIHPFIGDIIDIGADCLNPVQVNARDMNPEALKREFGDRIAFWGGVDTQKVLPFGTADEVRTEAQRMIDVLGRGGGYVFNSVHCIEPEVPPENVVAMFEASTAHSYAKSG